MKVRLYLRVLGELNMRAYANHVHLYCMSPTAVEYIESQIGYIITLTLAKAAGGITYKIHITHCPRKILLYTSGLGTVFPYDGSFILCFFHLLL